MRRVDNGLGGAKSARLSSDADMLRTHETESTRHDSLSSQERQESNQPNQSDPLENDSFRTEDGWLSGLDGSISTQSKLEFDLSNDGSVVEL